MRDFFSGKLIKLNCIYSWGRIPIPLKIWIPFACLDRHFYLDRLRGFYSRKYIELTFFITREQLSKFLILKN